MGLAHNFHPSCGCASCCRTERAMEREDEYMDTLHNDPKACAEADSWWSGTLDASQYSEMESALADLHTWDATKVLDSDVMTRLYRLAKVCHGRRDAELRAMARREKAA